jgi:protein-S-isoprenylcysteine O-methyltransferase Ste14
VRRGVHACECRGAELLTGMRTTAADRLELRVPPVVLVILTAAMMYASAWATPGLRFRLPHPDVIGSGAAVVGVIVSILGVIAFKRAKTTVNPTRPGSSSSLVASGLYRRTRNPMYLGFALVPLGWAVFLSNVLAFVLLPGFVLYMNRFQIKPEENALESRFGREFIDYKRRTRRWI